MSDDERLAELLVRWEDEYDRGRELTPEELCRDTPHLAGRVAQEIARLKQFRSPLAAVETTPLIPPLGQPMGLPPPPVRAFAGKRFEPQRHHASGGLGDVFVAVDAEFGREVALKRIKPMFADAPGDRARFEREAEITGRLEHPGVVPLYGKGQDADGRPYYAMRFIRGQTLRAAVKEFYQPNPTQNDLGVRSVAFRALLQSFTAACNTVAYAHSRGVIHRDLKPDNIMLGPYGEALVVDWGLAKHVGRDEAHHDAAEPSVRPAPMPDGEETRPGSVLGTPEFMAPEQARGEDVGPASDVFSLGATLYELLTQKTPYQGTMALVDAAAGTFPRPRQVHRDAPLALEAVCLKAMAKRPADRYATAQELARDVERWLADEPPTAYREPWRLRVRRWLKRHRTLVAATAAALLVGALLIGGGVWWKVDQDGRAAAAAAAAKRDLAQHVNDDLETFRVFLGEGKLEDARAPVAQAKGRLRGGGSDDLQRSVRQAEKDLNTAIEAAEARQTDAQKRDVLAALAETSRLEGEGQWPAAQAATARAAGRLGDGGTEELQRAVRQAQADLKLEAKLEELAIEAAEPQHNSPLEPNPTDRAGPLSKGLQSAGMAAGRAPAQIDGDYAAVLRDDGAPLDTADPETMAAWVRASAIREQLIQALDNWAYLKRRAKLDGAERLGEAAQRADGNDWRRRLRDLSAQGDRAALEQLAGKTEVVQQSPAALAELGRSLSQVGATAVAVEMLRKAQRRYPGDLSVNLQLAKGLLDSVPSDKEEALGFLRASLAIRPNNSALHDELGIVLDKQGQLDAAAQEYQRAIELDPKDADPHNGLGVLLKDQGQPDAAATEFRRAIELDPKLAYPHFNLGVLLMEQGKPDAAAEEYRCAIELDPKDANPHNNLGILLKEQGQLNAAAEEYRRAIELDPKDALPHYNLGVLLKVQGQLDAAAEEYRRAIELDPKAVLPHNGLGNVLMDQGQPDAAATEFRRAIELDLKNALPHYGLGNVLYKQGKPDAAATEYRRAIELDPKDALPHNGLGVLLKEQGQPDAAATEYRRAIELDLKYAYPHYNLGVLLMEQGQLDAAATEYRRAIELDPKAVLPHNNLGNVLDKQGQLDAAAQEYRRAIDLDPKAALPHNGLGNVLMEQGQPDAAAQEYRRAIELDPKLAYPHNNLGNVLKDQGKLDAAAQEYRRAIELDPKLAYPHNNLGLLLRSQGKFDLSIPSLQRAIELLTPGDSRRPNWQTSLSQTKRLLELDQNLPDILKSERQVSDPAEGVELARLCQDYKRRYVASTRFYKEAFAQRPALADDLENENRYNAACVASLAAAGKGVDANKLDDKERAGLRNQALDWLRADLTARDKRREDDPKAGPEIQKTLQHWQKDADLTGVRDADALSKLPEPERAAWRKLWADVADLLNRVDAKKNP